MNSPIVITSKNKVAVVPGKLSVSMKRLMELANQIVDAFDNLQGKKDE